MTTFLTFICGVIVGVTAMQIIAKVRSERNRVRGRRGLITYYTWFRDTPEQKKKVEYAFEVLETRGKKHRVRYTDLPVDHNPKRLGLWIDEDTDVIKWIDGAPQSNEQGRI